MDGRAPVDWAGMSERRRRPLAELPELDVKAPGLAAKSGRVAVGHGPRDRDQQRAIEQPLAVVRLDRLTALVARGAAPVTNRIGPARANAATEVTSHERMFAYWSRAWKTNRTRQEVDRMARIPPGRRKNVMALYIIGGAISGVLWLAFVYFVLVEPVLRYFRARGPWPVREVRAEPTPHRPISVPLGGSRLGRMRGGYRVPREPTRA
jgi:hypothetical protein